MKPRNKLTGHVEYEVRQLDESDFSRNEDGRAVDYICGITSFTYRMSEYYMDYEE